MFNFICKKSKGFTISEVIIAIAVLSFGVVLVYGAFYTAFNTTLAVGPRFTAAYLVQDGQEIIRNIRDTNVINNENWSSGLLDGSCTTGCQADYKTLTSTQLLPYDSSAFLGLNSDGFYSYDIGASGTIFKRKITISPVLGTIDVMKVNVLVTWMYNGQTSNLSADEYLYK